MKSIPVESIGAIAGTGGFQPGPPLFQLQTMMSERWFLLPVTVSLLGVGPEPKVRQVFTVVELPQEESRTQLWRVQPCGIHGTCESFPGKLLLVPGDAWQRRMCAFHWVSSQLPADSPGCPPPTPSNRNGLPGDPASRKILVAHTCTCSYKKGSTGKTNKFCKNPMMLNFDLGDFLRKWN